ncbi:hypothetical protein NW062_01790 [Mycoplasmopsis cynos]|nr:hypothetical protein NW062_01790 [Mycoplasmopsis cynos]
MTTGCLLAVWFKEQETTLGYQRLLEMIFKKHDFPKMIFSVKEEHFGVR